MILQLYRDGLEDLLVEREKKRGKEDERPASLKVTLAEHSPTGLVQVSEEIDQRKTRRNGKLIKIKNSLKLKTH